MIISRNHKTPIKILFMFFSLQVPWKFVARAAKFCFCLQFPSRSNRLFIIAVVVVVSVFLDGVISPTPPTEVTSEQLGARENPPRVIRFVIMCILKPFRWFNFFTKWQKFNNFHKMGVIREIQQQLHHWPITYTQGEPWDHSQLANWRQQMNQRESKSESGMHIERDHIEHRLERSVTANWESENLGLR